MAYIVFYQHPGDLINIVNYHQNEIVLRVGNLNLELTAMVKMIRGGFKVLFTPPSHRLHRESLIKTLTDMQLAQEIIEFSL